MSNFLESCGPFPLLRRDIEAAIAALTVNQRAALAERSDDLLVQEWLLGNQSASLALAHRHVTLVEYVVRRYGRSWSHFDQEELLSAGWLAFWNAASKFDAKRGAAFSTYAYRCIQGAALDQAKKLQDLPGDSGRALSAVSKATQELPQRLGRMPTQSEIIDEASHSLFGLPRRRFREKTAKLAVLRVISVQQEPRAILGEDNAEGNSAPVPPALTAGPLPEELILEHEGSNLRRAQNRKAQRRLFTLSCAWLSEPEAMKRWVLSILHELALDVDRDTLIEEFGLALPGSTWREILELLQADADFPAWKFICSHYGLPDTIPCEWEKVRSLFYTGRVLPSTANLRKFYQRSGRQLNDCLRLHRLISALIWAAGEIDQRHLGSAASALLMGYVEEGAWPLGDRPRNQDVQLATRQAGRDLLYLITELGRSHPEGPCYARLCALFKEYFAGDDSLTV